MSSRFEEITNEVKSLHPYDFPEIVGIPASNVSGSYLDWVKE